MKTTAKFAFLFSLLVLLTQLAYGQNFLDRMKEKANKKIEKRLEEKMDKELDKQLDKVENSIDSLSEGNDASGGEMSDEDRLQARMQSMMKGLGMSGEPVPVETHYRFTQQITMLVESFDKSQEKSSSGEFITHLNPGAQNMAYEVVSGDIGSSEQGIFIIDSKNKAIILLNDNEEEKSGIVYGMGTFFEDIGEMEFENVEDEEMPDNIFSHPNVNKTGKTKSIAGYKCEQYTYTDDETESEFWITKELNTSSADFFGSLFKTSLYTNGMGWGYVMESISKDKRTGDENSMRVTKVDRNSRRSFDLTSYQITNLGSFSMPAQPEE